MPSFLRRNLPKRQRSAKTSQRYRDIIHGRYDLSLPTSYRISANRATAQSRLRSLGGPRVALAKAIRENRQRYRRKQAYPKRKR